MDGGRSGTNLLRAAGAPPLKEAGAGPLSPAGPAALGRPQRTGGGGEDLARSWRPVTRVLSHACPVPRVPSPRIPSLTPHPLVPHPSRPFAPRPLASPLAPRPSRPTHRTCGFRTQKCSKMSFYYKVRHQSLSLAVPQLRGWLRPARRWRGGHY